MLRSALFNVWFLIIILVTISRKMIEKMLTQKNVNLPKTSNITDLFFDTVQIAFCGVGNLTIKNKPTKILLTFLSIFYLLAGLLCSGSFFQEITAGTYKPQINSIEDLNKTNLTINVSSDLNENTFNWLKMQ